MTLLTTAFAQGTHAARPAAAASNTGFYYFETDTQKLFQSTGSAWVQLAASVAASGGTVTSVSSANSAITVATPTTTPALTLATLDVIAADGPPAADWSNNSKKITSLANGTAASDAAAFGQIPTALPPNGAAGGNLSGSYPNPTVADVGILTTKGDLLVRGGSAPAGRLPVGSDTQVLTADSTQTLGVKWAAAAGGGAMSVLFDSTLSVAAGSIDSGVGGFSTSLTALLIFTYLRANTGVGTSDSATLTFNNDSAAHYNYQRINISNTSLVGALTGSGTSVGIDIPGNGASANIYSSGRWTVYNYANGSHFPSFEAQEGTMSNDAAHCFSNSVFGYYASTTAISRVTVACANNLAAGSRMTIYGIQ